MLTIYDVMKWEWKGKRIVEIDTETGKMEDITDSIDYVKVIRCKDCKHWDGRYCYNKWWGDGYGNYTPPIKTEEGYCDWAEMNKE